MNVIQEKVLEYQDLLEEHKIIIWDETGVIF